MLDVDVNYMLHRQQMALLRAAAAASPESRAAHEDMARAYREKVRDYARENRRAVAAESYALG
jgi:hypothetical protein